ncbi:MAG: DUF1269 domain-containing protein [Candidatus Promineifilaceae bacterium]|nr:DUF1269 domain-containing protein [Candidatus Promineifilaceae bacterium]
MAEKDTELIIAYFPTADAAQEAGHHLKEWDKERKDIELGAMSILTLDEKGEVKEDKVGARAGGKGAKWGMIAGAALGILTGGVTLIGGALVGLLAGGLGGSLFHKAIGMSDDDQARLEKHLKEGGAALAVMMDPDEIESTVSELQSLNAEVASYLIPEDVMQHMDRMAKGDAVIHELAEKYTEGEVIVDESGNPEE